MERKPDDFRFKFRMLQFVTWFPMLMIGVCLVWVGLLTGEEVGTSNVWYLFIFGLGVTVCEVVKQMDRRISALEERLGSGIGEEGNDHPDE